MRRYLLDTGAAGDFTKIAAIALNLGNCTVVTTDADLSAVPGLAIERWTS
jgi:predicted nucleic acid-binding protein